LIFYSTALHFKQTNVTPGLIPDGVGGFFEFLKGRVVVPANGNLHQFRRVIRHELVHVFTMTRVRQVLRDHRLPADHYLPLWFTEGLAEYWSGTRGQQYEMMMSDAVLSNRLVGLQDMYRISGSYAMYKHGEGLMHFLAETYGEESLLRLIEHLWIDKDFERVMEFVLGDPIDEIDDRWQRWIKAPYYAKARGLTAASLASTRISRERFGANPVTYRKRDGTRLVVYLANHTGRTNLVGVEVDSDLRPAGPSRVLVRGERTDEFESFSALDSRLSVSGDGRLAFVTRSSGQDVIHVYDLETDALEATHRFENIVAVFSPSWHPDGFQMAFSAIREDGFTDLYVFDTADGTLRRLTADHYDDRDPVWSPDGRRLAFSSDRTKYGPSHAYNLFVFELESGSIQALTNSLRRDFTPSWSPDGSTILFVGSEPDSAGHYGLQNVWKVDVPERWTDEAATRQTLAGRVTSFTSAAFHPQLTEDEHLLLTVFENQRFTVRSISRFGALLRTPSDEIATMDVPAHHDAWAFETPEVSDVEPVRYRRRYRLDLAQGGISQNPVWGASGGAVLALSDMLGDHHWFVTLYNTAQSRGNILRNMNVAVSRLELNRRVNVGYGAYRFGGLRYDVTDPDALAEYPLVWESIYGGYGSLSYPLSQFRRVEVSSSLNWNEKQIPFKEINRSALLASVSAALVHDNALYHYNGPVEGWRANLTVGFTADMLFDNVSYGTLAADIRTYVPLLPDVSFASRGLLRLNHGREARLFFLGGSWDLRGWRFFDVRASKMWFTSHELRVPILNAPSLYLPLLQPFGVVNLRGSLFVDAAHAWNDDYRQRSAQLNTGETIGSAGAGLRLNLFGGFILRYDVGYRYRDGFRHRERYFRQFFFGYDF
ncbi:MAG: BamA/TamA family outer membrane protein, partial [Rhodothermales bacterium]